MPNPTWPTTLPNPSWGLQAGGEDNAVRTGMDAGPRKVRRRYTKPVEDVRGSLELTDAQATILRDFVVVTLKDVLPFDWTNFISNQTATYRFVGRPRFTRVGYDNVRADFQLELLP